MNVQQQINQNINLKFDSELMIPTKQPVTFSGNRSIKNSKNKLKSETTNIEVALN